MQLQPQQLALLVDFVKGLPPAVVELLQLVYDSNLQLIQQVEAKNNAIKQLKLVHAAALDQRDQQIEDLKGLVAKLQQQDAQDPQAVPAAAPAAPAQPASPSTDTLQAQHADAGQPAASTKRPRAAAHDSEDQFAAAAAECPPPKRVHLSTPGTPGSGAAAAAAPAAQQEAAAAASQPAAAAASPARSIRALSAGTFKLEGCKSPTEPPAHQQQQQPQQPAAGQAPAAVHVKKAAGAAPASGDDQAAAASGVSASTPGTGQQQQQQHQHQQAPQLAAGPYANKAAPQNPNKPAEPFDPQQALAFVNNFLQQHRSMTTTSSTGRAPSSTGGTRGPSSTGGGGAAAAAAAAAAAPRLAHSDGGSAATVFDASLAAQYVSRQLARLSGGGMQVPFDVAGAPGAAAGVGAADLAAASAAAVQAASQLLASGLLFGFNAAPHRGQVPAAGYGPPAMYDPSTAMQQYMLGPLPGYTVPVSTGQHRSASAQPLGYAAATGQLFGGQQRPFSAAAAAAGGGGGGLYSGYGAGAAEFWQQNLGSMMGAEAAAGPAAAAAAAAVAAAGWQQQAEVRTGAAGRRPSSTGADRRSSSGDDQPLSNAEANWQREIERKVPASVQDAIRATWLGEPGQQQRRLLPVTCNGVFGTFFVDAQREPFIRTAGGQELKPAQFERECGKGQSKDPWRTIRVPGFQGKNGAIQLGQFCRIAGIYTGRWSSSA